jgi:hypothetical protein
MQNLILIIIYEKTCDDENEDDDNKQYRILAIIISLLLSKLFDIKEIQFEKKLFWYFTKLLYVLKSFADNMNSHPINEIYGIYQYILYPKGKEDNFEAIKAWTKKLCLKIKIFYEHLSQNNKIISFMENCQDSNNQEDKKCGLCQYIETKFKIQLDFLYQENEYYKIVKAFFRNYYLNFGKNKDIFGKTKYVWNLSLKESHEKIHNKLFIKENNIKVFYQENQRVKILTEFYRFYFNKARYINIFKRFHKLFLYDKISTHINLLENLIENKQCQIFQCLIIKKLRKILSSFILYDDKIYIF